MGSRASRGPSLPRSSPERSRPRACLSTAVRSWDGFNAGDLWVSRSARERLAGAGLRQGARQRVVGGQQIQRRQLGERHPRHLAHLDGAVACRRRCALRRPACRGRSRGKREKRRRGCADLESQPSSSRTSRTSAAWGDSPGSTLPPGNSHSSGMVDRRAAATSTPAPRRGSARRRPASACAPPASIRWLRASAAGGCPRPRPNRPAPAAPRRGTASG